MLPSILDTFFLIFSFFVFVCVWLSNIVCVCVCVCSIKNATIFQISNTFPKRKHKKKMKLDIMPTLFFNLPDFVCQCLSNLSYLFFLYFCFEKFRCVCFCFVMFAVANTLPPPPMATVTDFAVFALLFIFFCFKIIHKPQHLTKFRNCSKIFFGLLFF